jgi:hypothetical protein
VNSLVGSLVALRHEWYDHFCAYVLRVVLRSARKNLNLEAPLNTKTEQSQIDVSAASTALVPATGFWMRRVEACIRACTEVMFPVNDEGAPDWKSTDIVARTIDYLYELPPPTRRLVMTMFVAIEFGATGLLAGIGLFSWQSLGLRTRAIHRWRGHWFLPYAMLADALKAQLCMMYLSHPAVQHYIGAWKTCERPNDPLGLPVRTGVYSATTHSGLVEGV